MTLPPGQRHATTENRLPQDDCCNVRYWVTGWPRWGFVQCTDCARLAAPKDPQRGAG